MGKKRMDGVTRANKSVLVNARDFERFEKLVNRMGHSYSSAIEKLQRMVIDDKDLQGRLDPRE